MSIRYFSVTSGIEGASVAWESLGWEAVGFSEIDPAASRVLAHRWPHVRNHGDFTKIFTSGLGPIDILVGGTPCQAFSVAGKRRSLDDARGNLALSFVELAHELREGNGLRNVLWENVPGVLNTHDNAFGCFISGLVGADDALSPPVGAKWPSAGMVAGPKGRLCWRILDAQYFGLAQRRKRVFVVVDFGNGADPATVLFERQGLRGNSPPRRQAREGIAPTLSARTKGGGGLGTDFDCDGGLIAAEIAPTLNAHFGDKQGLENQHIDGGCGMFVAHALRGEGFDASEDGMERGTPIVPVLAFSCKDSGADATSDLAPTLRSMGHAESHANAGGQMAVAFDLRGREGGAQFEGPHDTANIRAASGGSSRSYVAQQWAVRRLLPVECEKLQGFPSGHTLVPDARGKLQADGPRYKQLGNSFAVNVVRWIGQRIDAELDKIPPWLK